MPDPRGLARVAVRGSARSPRRAVRLRHAAKVRGTGEAADAVGEIFRRELGREGAVGRVYLPLLLPNRFELRNFLVESHAAQEAVDALLYRLGGGLLDRSARIPSGARARGFESAT